MTLKQLGARAALSHPFLSQVERGLAVPSIGALQRIASALQVPTGHLWSSGRRKHFVQSTAREDAPVLPAYDGSNAGEVRVLMAADQPMHVLEATGLSTAFAPRTMVNEGDVVVYVVSGAIEVDLDGTTYELAAGGAIEFSGVLPSNLRRTGPPDTRVLFVRTQPQDV
jgi:transcriptional regulator with XRE-family HTH domain